MPRFSLREVPQHNTSKLAGDGPQLELLPTRAPCPPVDKAYTLGLPNLRRVIRYSVSLPDLEAKQVYIPLKMDKATWSRIANGDMSFPADLLGALADVTQNEAPLIWWAHQRGFDLRPLKSELQEQLDAERAEKLELRRENELLRSLFRETRK